MSSQVTPSTAPESNSASAKKDAQIAKLDQFVSGQVQKAAAHVRWVEVATHLALAATIFLASLLVFCVIDAWLLSFSPMFRLVALVAIVLGCLGYAIWKTLPLLILKINPVYAAKMIEDAQPGLKNSLLNYLTLRNERADSGSKPLSKNVMQMLQNRAATDISQTPVENTVDRTKLIRIGFVLIGIILFAGVYKLVSPKDPFQSIARLMAPFADISTPSRVRIQGVEPGNVEIYFGETVEISATIKGLSESEQATVIYSSTNDEIQDAVLPLEVDSSGRKYFGRLTTDKGSIQQTLHYYVVAGDTRSNTCEIKVSPRPTLSVESVELSPPKYTELPAIKLEKKVEIEGLEGTRVKINALSNLPMERAWIELFRINPENPDDITIVEEQKMEVDDRDATGEFVLRLRRKKVEGKLEVEPAFTHYRLQFIALDGKQTEQPTRYPVKVIPDLTPEVEITNPESRESEQPQNRVLPLIVAASDPDFKISSMEVTVVHGGKNLVNQKLPLGDQNRIGRVTGSFRFLPKKFGLKAGDKVVVFATAFDNRMSPMSGLPDPNQARTKNYEIKILPPVVNEDGGNGGDDSENPDSDPNDDSDGNKDENQNNKPNDKPESKDKNSKSKNKDSKNSQSGDEKSGKQNNDDSNQRPKDGQNDSDSKDSKSDTKDKDGGKGSENKDDNSSKKNSDEKGDDGKTGNDQSKSGDKQNDRKSSKKSDEKNKKGEAKKSKSDNKTKGNSNSKQKGAEEGEKSQQGGDDSKNGSAEKNSGGSKSDEKTTDEVGDNPNRSNQNEDSAAENRENSPSQGDGNPEDKPLEKNAHEGEKFEKLDQLRKRAERENQNRNPDNNATENGSDQGDSANPEEKPESKGDSDRKSGKGDNKSADKAGDKKGSDDKAGGNKGADKKGADKKGSDKAGDKKGKGDTKGKGGNKGTDSKKSDSKNSDKMNSKDKGSSDKAEPNKGNAKDPDSDKSNKGGGDKKSDSKGDNKNRDTKNPAGKDTNGDKGKGKGQNKKNSQETSDKNSDSAGKSDDAGKSDGSKKKGSDKGNSKDGSAKKGEGGKQGDSKESKSGDKSASDSKGADTKKSDEGGKKSNAQKSDGSKKGKAGENGSKGKKTENKDGAKSESAKQGDESGAESKGEPNSENQNNDKNNRAKSANRRPGTGQRSGNGDQSNADPVPEDQLTEEQRANLEYTKEVTDLALEYLENQKQDPDPEMLKQMNWTKEEMNQFLERWKKMKQNANSDPVNSQKDYTDKLRSLGLKDPRIKLKDQVKSDAVKGLNEDGSVLKAPPEYAEEYHNFQKFRNQTDSKRAKRR